MAMAYSTATFALGNWTMTVTGMRSVPNADDLVAGPKHRIDIGFTARGDAPSRDRPHGIIGQSYATPGRVRFAPPPLPLPKHANTPQSCRTEV